MMPSRDSHLTLTGQLGDVMKESAMAALSYVRSNAETLGIDPRVFENKSFHIHVPEGAIPKDGPSAGVTMMTAIVSLVSARKVRSDVAMTGEISLRGKVLPIGGLREKILAAHRAGITTVIFPRRNEAELEDLPPELREQMTFVPVDDAREVLERSAGGWSEHPRTLCHTARTDHHGHGRATGVMSSRTCSRPAAEERATREFAHATRAIPIQEHLR